MSVSERTTFSSMASTSLSRASISRSRPVSGTSRPLVCALVTLAPSLAWDRCYLGGQIAATARFPPSEPDHGGGLEEPEQQPGQDAEQQGQGGGHDHADLGHGGP